MMNFKKRTLLLSGLLIAALLSGCAEAEVLPYMAGTWDADIYTSPFLSFSFTLPEGWTAASDAELSDMDAAAEEALQAQRKDGTAPGEPVFHYALLAKPEGGGDTTGVTVLAQRSEVGAKEYAVALKNGAKAENAGYTLGDDYTVTVAGQEYIVIPVTVAGNAATQRQYVRAEGGYLVNIMVFASGDGQFAEIEGAFSPVAAS